MTKVANCGHDERGKYSGGKPGDQSGTEWYVREDYDFGQSVFLVHPNDKVNDLMARMAVNGARNDHVGYCQGHRTTFYEALKRNKWVVGTIKEDCESDCSSGVAALGEACVQRLKLGKAHISKDVYTGNLKAAFVAAGWKAYTKAELLGKYGKKPKGCIQLNPSRHVNVVVEGASNLAAAAKPKPKPSSGAKAAKPSAAWVRSLQDACNKAGRSKQAVDGIPGPDTLAGCPTLRRGGKGAIVKLMQQRLVSLGYSCGSCGADGDFGPGTEGAVRKFQATAGIASDGIAGRDTWRKLLCL